MKYFSLIFFFLSINLFSQDLEKIMQSEVLFVTHNGINGHYQSRTYHNVKNQRAEFFYKFYVVNKDKNEQQDIEIILTYSHYYDFDEKFKDNPVPYFKINKSFLKKNKDIIVTGDFMNQIGYVESFNLINNAKTIFLIDKSEIQNRKLVIKQVKHFFIREE